ncbi:ABC1-domain-containing protein [Guyanagaster necrorhizus]|uniref:ABC1-domain-containing protein n=1 Tax=Guyanagaster necrorhizus TaxID=856835 RepID=A0A9P8AXA0_9AGAR|nr:ABC1-domain-containing protein [Guyanagaster necrorhizus MCA 3950]KAG7450996.1 ABC1-domain-containing protein [Guyanagaster necrorhizus MCA 3950]
MPPGPAYNWLCVLSSAADILGHAARIRASQIAGQRSVLVSRMNNRDAPALEENKIKTEENVRPVVTEPFVLTRVSILPREFSAEVKSVEETQEIREDSVVDSIPYETAPPTQAEEIQAPLVFPTRNLSSSKVPSSRIGRLFHYGGLAASLSYGAASELLRRTGDNQASVMMTEANIKRLVSKLSQMRGAALKLGQFLSIQDTHLLPPEVDKIFRRVQDSAHYMPDWQMEKVLQNSLGTDWSSHFDSFDRIPFAAASIGQVHSAVLKASASPTGEPYRVAVKIQFPNIANSIDSDLGYIKLLLTAGKFLPKGLFLDKTVSVMKRELADECDYSREASFLRTFGSPEYLGNDPRFKIPWVWKGSTDRVLVMERIDGISVGEADVKALSQPDRDTIAACVIELCLKELFEFRMMQTDPNWTNFLWDARTRQIGLVDFGATRLYSKEFMDGWLKLLQAAASDDWDACVEWSLKVGYLTGQENQIMLDAHVKSMTLLAAPFKASTPQPYTFGRDSSWADITAQIRNNIPVMLEHRLTPPPQETYSLNRKLSGAFLLASRLEATVDTKDIWDRLVGQYTFSS